MRKAGWILLGFALLATGPQCGCPSQKATIAFEPRTPPRIQVERIFKEDGQALTGFQQNETDRALVALFKQVNVLTTRPAAGGPQLESALRKLQSAARKYTQQHGQDRARLLGLSLLQQFEQRLQSLTKQSNTIPGSADAMFMGMPPDKSLRKAYESFAQLGGSFLKLAAVNGLITRNKIGGMAMVDTDRFFIRLAFKVYWANLFAPIQEPPDWMCATFEINWYDIWVAERSRTAPLQRKLGAVVRLKKRDSNDPDHKARGILFFLAGQHARSARAFKAHIEKHPEDKQAVAFLAQTKPHAHAKKR